MATQEGTYYVPEQSKLPLMMALGMFVTVFGAGNWINELENPTPNGIGMTVFFMGFHQWLDFLRTKRRQKPQKDKA